MIDRIGSVNPVLPSGNPNGINHLNHTAQSDSIKLSSEALERSELYQISELVNAMPDIRADVVAELKQQINDPAFINDAVIDVTVDALMAVFGL
jgi:hypothetical protein